MLRVRHCLECPKCRTRYLPGSSPYDNGSYLVPITEIASSGWILYCSCGFPAACSEWRWSELKPYEVCGPAYYRGYGSPDEVWDVTRDSRVTLTDAMLKAMWPRLMQLSSSQNQVRRERSVLVKLLKDKYPLCNNESEASARARFVRKLLIYRHRCKSRAA